ncbi:hypothetical protein WR25_04046 [Diploscapter pachys]|uniref:ETS domain-containing protein n=1 Tax=Diploscapter pachys TaxID=2018661 RepID=A0A2A2KM16_9BILA|nr:hypothetical protein WR25_04046 [Diploscapter pachys]
MILSYLFQLLDEDIRITRWLNPLQNNPSGNAELAQIVGDASTVRPNATENLGYRYPCEDQAVFYSDANQPGPSNANTAIVRQRCFSDPAPIQQQHPCHFQFPSHNQFFPQQHPLPYPPVPVSQPQFHLMANQSPQPAQICYSYSFPLPVAPQQTVKRGRPGRKPKSSGRQSPKQVIYKEGQQGRRGNTPRLLPFTLRLLMNPQYRDIVDWTGVGLEFIITNRTRLAYIWGMHKSNRPMKYTNLARSFRYLGEKGLVAHSHKTFEFTFLPRFFEITPEFRMDEVHQYAQERGKEYQASIRRQAN